MGMGWVGSWIHKFTWQWVGLDLYVCGLGWVVGYENGPMDNSASLGVVENLAENALIEVNC